MPFQLSPGVNVSEIDLTTVIPAVSSTEGAIAGAFQWGPVNQRVLVDSEDRLVAVYGKPTSDTANDFFTSANFLSYGNALYVNRVAGSGYNNAGALSTGIATGAAIDNEDDYNENYLLATKTGDGEFVAKYPGTKGNSLKVSVCSNADAFENTIASISLGVTNGSSTVTVGTADAQVEFKVGDYILIGSNRVQHQITGITSSSEITISPAWNGTTGSETVVTRRWEYYNFFSGAPTTTDYVANLGGSNDALHIAIIDEDGQFTGVLGQVIERFENVSQASDAKTDTGANNYYVEVINQQSAYVWIGETYTSFTESGDTAQGADFSGTIFSNGGETSGRFSASFEAGNNGTTVDSGDKVLGYDIFKSAEEVDISFLLGSEADSTLAIHLINNVAEYRKDCIVVLSPERADCVNNNTYEGAEADDIVDFRNSLPSSSYAVMDSAWKYQYDKYNDTYRYVPMNGDTAGLMVQTDQTRDPWWSPAGFNRGNIKNVIRLSWNPNKTERDALYKNGINPVVSFPGQGTVLYGDKTLLSKPSAFDRINVRRLFIVLEKAISTASKFTLFEFNDEFTRSQFRNMVEPFLRDVQGRRGIYDYRVVCDSTNNTGEIIDRNEFVGDIYIKPARSINFIQLNFVAVRTGVEFSEVVGKF